MISGAHVILSSKKPEADREFLRDVLGLPHIDVGDGWLIFGLPPAEVAVHPSRKNDVHEFYLMCDDVDALVLSLGERGVRCAPVQNLGWGLLTQVDLPGGGKLGIYQPRHARPKSMAVRKAKKARAQRKRGGGATAKSRTASKAGNARSKKVAKQPATRKTATRRGR